MTESHEHILIVTNDAQISGLLIRVLLAANYQVTQIEEGAKAIRQAPLIGAKLVIVAEKDKSGSGMELAGDFARRLPNLPVILFAPKESTDLFKRALRAGVADVICPPMKTEDIMRAIRGALDLAHRRQELQMLESRKATSGLQRQVDEMETIMRLGRQVTSSLEPDSVLSAIVAAAVELTSAEEGSLLLLDENTGDLYMRASRNFQEDFVRTFRLPVTDSLAGSVIRTGEAMLLDEQAPQKIKTSYLVQSLLYVPLARHGHIFGVLGVDNRHSRLPLTQQHVKLLNTLASFAVIALENAHLYEQVSAERNKLETILTGVKDGVIVVDQDNHLALVNQAARDIFGLSPDAAPTGAAFAGVFPQPEMLALLNLPEDSLNNRTEITPREDVFYSVMETPIQGIGRVFTLHDITYLKKLDRIKTDFVHTVSHDLRSPLTAILGYVELIERAGKVTDLQHDFIRRVQVSVHNITHLVDDLLDLGRIESGFDVRKEIIQIDQILHYSADSLKKRLAEKNQTLELKLPEQFPPTLANPVQMRELMDNLLDNAVKYTGAGGTITVTGEVEDSQIILRFCDTGIGIPALDLPYIFDKFYRATNASGEMSGTGLGLAIVKSVIDNHEGRIWVDSTQNKGSTFTVVLPVMGQ